MQAYHSKFNKDKWRTIGGLAIVPLAAQGGDGKEDLVGEALTYFRANVFFQQFEVKGAGDRMLIYLTLFIQKCLNEALPHKTYKDAKKALGNAACLDIALPQDGSGRFPFEGMCSAPGSPSEAGTYPLYAFCGMVVLEKCVG